MIGLNFHGTLHDKMQTDTQTLKWMGKNAKPSKMGWYYVRNIDSTISIRHYEEDNGGSWWYPSPQYGYKPNDSFVEWALIPELHV